MKKYNRDHGHGGVKTRSRIIVAVLLLSVAGPPAMGLAAPRPAEAQVYPERQVVRFLGLDVCAWFNCHGSYCCGPRVDPFAF